MKLSQLIINLQRIYRNAGKDLEVFVEVNHQQEKNGNYDFFVSRHHHEASVWNGVEQPEIDEVIIMPDADEGFLINPEFDKEYAKAEVDKTPAKLVIFYSANSVKEAREMNDDYEEDEDFVDLSPLFVIKKNRHGDIEEFLKLEIDLERHKIIDWEEKIGEYFSFSNWKMRDEGTYILLNKSNEEIISFQGYVPNKVLPPKDGAGDYLSLYISNDGTIMNWYERPDLQEIFKIY